MNDNIDFLKIYDFKNKKRLGNNNDGGYIIAILEGNYDFYISAGISTEESFSRDFIELYNMNKHNCAAFDGTINNYPYNYTKKIIFYRRNISPIRSDTTSNLSYFIDNYNDIFLKMDIEGSEYPWLESLTENQLKKFKQIVIEFHGINDDSWGTTLNDKIKCFEKLSKTHYALHIHGNNWEKSIDNIPNVIELTYVRKDQINEKDLALNKSPLPTPNLDFPNRSDRKDHDLNFPPFVNY